MRDLTTLPGRIRVSQVLILNTLATGCGGLLAWNLYWVIKYWGTICSTASEVGRFIEYGVFGGSL